MKTDDLVREFHEQADQGAASYPTAPDAVLAQYRRKLIEEEFKEVQEELTLLACGNRTYAESMEILGRLLKELCDLRYVIEGTAVAMGLPMEEAYRAVHASNMSKRFPDGTFHTDKRGKVVKGPDYEPPDMARFVQVVNEEN